MHEDYAVRSCELSRGWRGLRKGEVERLVESVKNVLGERG